MIKIGLTGSIGMGKSTVLKMFDDLGAATWDADAAVHRLYEKDGLAVEPIGAAFPGALENGVVDRAKLAALVLNDPKAIEKLEAIVHPLVWRDREAFMADAALAGASAVVLDIPLLFENGMDGFFDAVIVVSAPAEIQRERVLARPGMSEEKLDAILSRQLADAEKRQRADYVINTGQPLKKTQEDVEAAYNAILSKLAAS
ncbi:MAG: dephospho-CoA kinase [Pseudomonadota bacterium]